MTETAAWRTTVVGDVRDSWHRVPELRLGQLVYTAVEWHLRKTAVLVSEVRIADFLRHADDAHLANIISAWSEQ